MSVTHTGKSETIGGLPGEPTPPYTFDIVHNPDKKIGNLVFSISTVYVDGKFSGAAYFASLGGVLYPGFEIFDPNCLEKVEPFLGTLRAVPNPELPPYATPAQSEPTLTPDPLATSTPTPEPGPAPAVPDYVGVWLGRSLSLTDDSPVSRQFFVLLYDMRKWSFVHNGVNKQFLALTENPLCTIGTADLNAPGSPEITIQSQERRELGSIVYDIRTLAFQGQFFITDYSTHVEESDYNVSFFVSASGLCQQEAEAVFSTLRVVPNPDLRTIP